jgi:hypothetical protein
VYLKPSLIKQAFAILAICLFFYSALGQNNSGKVLDREANKMTGEYYSKQFIVDEVLKVGDRQIVEFYADAITGAHSGELTTVLYECKSLNKKGVVFVFWNNFVTGNNLRFQGYGFYHIDVEKAKELFNSLEAIMNQKGNALDYSVGNLTFKADDLTFLFYTGTAGDGSLVQEQIRVWYKDFDSDWYKANLKTTIRRFRKFFELEK